MKLKQLLTLVFTLVLSFGITAQTRKEVRGTKYFEEFSFSKAISNYESVGLDKLTTEGLRNLGDSYRYTHNTEKAEESYSSLANRTDNKAEDLYMYSEILLMNGKKAEWKQWMDKFQSRMSKDGRAEEFKSKKANYESLVSDRGIFSKLKNLSINTSNEEFSPAYCGDKVVFSSSRRSSRPTKRKWNGTEKPYLNLYESTPDSEGELNKVKSISKKINDKYHTGPASFSEDGKLMVFTRNYEKEENTKGYKTLKLMYSEMDEEGNWGEAKDFTFNNKEYNFQHPALTPDGKTIYFTSDMPGGQGSSDIYKVTKEGETWGTPVNLGDKINTEGSEGMPFYHPKGYLLFSSDGHIGLGGLDIFSSKIVGGSFEEPKNLGYPINDSKDDFSLIMNKEMTKGYFSSNRPGGKGSDDIYSFNMKPLESCTEVSGLAKNTAGEIVPGATVVAYDSEGLEVKSVTVGEEGKYVFCLSEGEYKLKASKDKYTDGLANLTVSTESVNQDLILDDSDSQPYRLIGEVTDKSTNELIDGVKITFSDPQTKQEEVYMVKSGKLNELLSAKLNENKDYKIKLEKEGYLTKNVTYNPDLKENNEFYISSDLLALEKGEGYAKEIITINRIYFDLDKSNIRPDAATELDKIVALMNKYPKMVIELRSYTDCRANNRYNKKLSRRRAKSSVNYIKKRIKNSSRIYGKGYGESVPLSNCKCEENGSSDCSEEEHQENRRTEFKIIQLGGAKVKNNSLSTQ